ncbi:glycosyltransferase, MGT family [Clostridium sp. DL-VIII]|uniref:macrolide family glycosyltransferase n=1 Tax=Clostridium sp. DL-VIII TaxID=641107 RepID=UPI00023AFA30|nr:macrolide family glycosyltransferase [Clostridium sp. DL-VIII]EHJ00640.1 glycosyltransferase, MGT family [Clostridium sp. DL-VIII]
MSKALFINILGHGHINPTIGIVKDLINSGEHVTYIAGEEFRDKIEKTGAKFIGHRNSFNVSNFINCGLDLESNEGLLNALNTFKEIVEVVFNSNEKYDYVIYDSSFILGKEIGKALKIPTITSTTTFAINKELIENVFKSPLSDELKRRFQGFKPKMKEILNSSTYKNFISELKEKYNINFPDFSNRFTKRGMINLVYTSRYFQPYGDNFDESYKFIGPSIINRNEDINIDLKNDNQKIVYISLGTIFNNSIDFYENCFKAFSNMDVKVIMSVGKNTDITSLSDIPSNFIVRNYVPQLEILKHSDVFITHGGMNSTNEGLYYDIPLILIPQSVDQPFVANRVAELGAGIVLDKNEITPEILNDSVTKVLSNMDFKINSKKIGESLREGGGYKKGVDEILALID